MLRGRVRESVRRMRKADRNRFKGSYTRERPLTRFVGSHSRVVCVSADTESYFRIIMRQLRGLQLFVVVIIGRSWLCVLRSSSMMLLVREDLSIVFIGFLSRERRRVCIDAH